MAAQQGPESWTLVAPVLLVSVADQLPQQHAGHVPGRVSADLRSLAAERGWCCHGQEPVANHVVARIDLAVDLDADQPTIPHRTTQSSLRFGTLVTRSYTGSVN